MPTLTIHVSIVKIAGMDHEAHINDNYGPSVTLAAMETLGISFGSYDESDSRTILCLQADTANQQVLDAAVTQGLAAWGAVELKEDDDPNDVTGLITIAGALRPSFTFKNTAGVDWDCTAPLVDTGNGKLKRDITLTP